MTALSRLAAPALTLALAAAGLGAVATPALGATDLATNAVATSSCRDADTPVPQMSALRAARAVVCLENAARTSQGLPGLLRQAQSAPLGRAATGHAVRAVTLRWWSFTDGAVSHVDPQTGSTPDQRIVAAGYCAAGPRRTAEVTFAASGRGPDAASGLTLSATPRSAVSWWLWEPGHRAVLLDPGLRTTGVGAVAGLAFPGQVFNPAGTFVQDFGRCG